MAQNVKKITALQREAQQSMTHTYDEEGREKINVSVRKDEDFLSPYSAAGEEYISGEFADFLDEASKPLDLKKGVHIVIYSHVIDEKEQVEYGKAMKNYYRGRIADVNAKRRRNLVASIVMLLVAAVILSVYVSLELTGHNYVLLELIDIVAWVFMWEAADLFFFERRALNREFLRDCMLYDAAVTFVDDGETPDCTDK